MIIANYILRMYLRYVISIVFLCVFLFILFDFLHRASTYFHRYNPTWEVISYLYLLQIPQQVNQALPIAALLASMITMMILSRNLEITAMRASGMSTLKIARPFFLAGLGLSAFSLLINEFIIPKTAKKMHYVLKVIIEGQFNDKHTENIKWLRKDHEIFYFGNLRNPQSSIKDVKLITLKDQKFEPQRIVIADSANVSTTQNIWEFNNGHLISVNNLNQTLKIEPFIQKLFPIDIKSEMIIKDWRSPEELSLTDLYKILKARIKSGGDDLADRVHLHFKIAFSFASLIVSLVGLHFGFRTERKAETVRSIILAFAVGIGYFMLINLARVVSTNGYLLPWVAAWGSNLIMFSIIVVLNSQDISMLKRP